MKNHNDIEELIEKHKSNLSKLQKRPFMNRNKIKQEKYTIQSLEEGQAEDVLTTSVTGTGTRITPVVDKNNFATYSKQVHDINEMYNCRTDYGAEFLRSAIDMRVAFIMGGGVSIHTRDKQVSKWIADFLNCNKLQGSKLLDIGTIGEMEGKCLLTLYPDKKMQKMKVRNYSWYCVPYDVKMDEKNNDKIKDITYQKNKNEAASQLVKPEDSVYVKLGGSPDRINRTPPRIANVLTDIDNVSRAKYDLRKNNHLFGRVTPYFETQDDKHAKTLHDRIEALSWKIGKAIAGTAKFSLVEPTGKGSDVLIQEMTNLIRIISTNTGIPLQWLAHPDILSNRAVAESMIETINAMTIKERMIWEESIKELIQKAMAKSFELGFIKWNKPDSFEVKLSLVSFALLKEIIETYIPLVDLGYISKDTIRSQIPGIDPYREKELIEEETEDEVNEIKLKVDNSLEDEMEIDEEDETE